MSSTTAHTHSKRVVHSYTQVTGAPSFWVPINKSNASFSMQQVTFKLRFSPIYANQFGQQMKTIGFHDFPMNFRTDSATRSREFVLRHWKVHAELFYVKLAEVKCFEIQASTPYTVSLQSHTPKFLWGVPWLMHSGKSKVNLNRISKS